jgi:two-component system, OmpR family, sensor kinase
MTTTTTDRSAARPAPRPEPSEAAEPPARARVGLAGVRFRILGAYVGLLALAALVSVLVARAILLGQLDARIDEELVQESSELRSLAAGNDPATATPFGGRVDRIFEVFLERNVPSRNEALVTFLDGRPFLRTPSVVPYRLDQDPVLVDRWANLTSTDRGSATSPEGRVEYLAVPLTGGGRTRGVFVAAIFADREQARYDTAVAAVGGVGAAVLVAGSVLAWLLAGTILRPVRGVTTAARLISDTDWTRRIEVRGRDEVAELARTFNAMLDRLERSFATQQRFLDDAGHELRTPLTILRGHLELMGDDPLEREETLELVLDELDRMGRIVGDLLLLAQAQQPDFLSLGPVDVDELTAEVFAKVQAMAPRTWRLEGVGRGVLVADRQRLTQAVVQLASNAVQHTGEGDEIVLGSRVEAGEARFWVRDTGPGVPEEDRERIFERFVHGRTRTETGGTGLGLSIVRAIAEGHRGRVELASRPGAGATFTVVVPGVAP